MAEDQYDTWLAKQNAMGRTLPATTAPYYPPKMRSTVVTVTDDGSTVVTECE